MSAGSRICGQPVDEAREQAMEHLIFNQWSDVQSALVKGVLAYVVLVVLLRISGKRTLSKFNAFDLIVTVALGSTLASIFLSKDVALAEGTAALALLIALQYVVTWSSVRISWIRRWVTGEPSMLLYQGRLLPDALRKMRVTEQEVLAAVRESGLPNLDRAEAVVLETDGTISVIERAGHAGENSRLQGLGPDSRSEPSS